MAIARLGRTGAGAIAFSTAASFAVASLSVSGCSRTQPVTLDGYCGVVQQNIAAINTPAIVTQADITAALELYRSISAQAPLAVAPEWRTMVASLQTAATVVPGDPASVAAANDAALSGQPAYTRIQQYTKANCGTDIGSPPPPTNPATPIPAPSTTG
jgi:hypothetical protein